MFNFFKRKPKEERTAPVEKPAQTPAQKSPQKPNDPMATIAPAAESSATATPKKSPGKSGPAVSGEEELKPGQTLSAPGLGDFLIHDIKGGVGKSGMGVVYIVLDESSMTPFAVKTFQQWCIGTPALVQRFLREVETWIKLEQHQNIVRAFYVSTINNQPHLFLEYVAGSDLRKKMAAGPLPVRDALRYSIQFCRGMDYAQKKVPGLVHRDVKPENCMFTPDDVLKVTDFGLVKVLSGSDKLPQQQQAPGKRLSENHTRVFKTQVGEMGVGTLPYMAPEQFTDFTHVTACADIYSFGIMLFEMLAGERPFSAKGPEQWFYKHLKIAPPEIANLNPEVSPLLAKLVSRCLAKKPEDRYSNFSTLELDLSRILQQEFHEEVVTAEPKALEAWEILNKGAALGNLGRIREALACVEKALKIYPNFDGAWLNKGVLLAKQGKEQTAMECYEKALELNPRSAHAWYNRGILFGTLGPEAEALLRRTERGGRSSMIYGNRTPLDEALHSYEQAIELNPRYDSAWLNKGVILRKLGRTEEALACYDKVLALNPQSSVAWHNKGVALRKLGRPHDELQCYDRAVALNPQYAEAWLNKGVAMRKQNRLIEALAAYDRALGIQPRYADAWYNKGVVLRKLAQPGEARAAFHKAGVLDPRIRADLKRQGLA